jgi:hypothetical protein
MLGEWPQDQIPEGIIVLKTSFVPPPVELGIGQSYENEGAGGRSLFC